MAPTPCSYCGDTSGPDHICPGNTAQLVGQLLDGRYEVEAVLGQGGMGMVFRAKQISMQREVAIKTLHASLAWAPTFFERFRREAEVASRLKHPNIITIYDFGRAPDGVCYYVMEMLEGVSLKALVKEEGPLSLRRAVNIIEQAARGLAHAHELGVVHRDLKPHNIMVSWLDGTDFVKVLDFGLVKALEEQEGEEKLTSTGQVLGTPQYMPPEQAGGELVDQRSDLYSLGGVLYYCLTGSSPYGARTVRKALSAALTQTPPTVGSKRSGAPVPRKVDEFLRKALAREKKDRHQTAEEFLDDLLDSVAGLSDAELDATPDRGDAPDGGSDSSSRGGSKSAAGRAHGSAPPPGRSRLPSAASRAGSGSRARPAGERTVSGARPTSPEIPSLKVAEASQATSAGAQKRTWLWALPVVFLAIIGLVFVATRMLLAGPTTPTKAAVPAATAKPPAPASAPTPTVSPDVTVQVRSNPTGALIFEDGHAVGQTPTALRLSRAEVHTLELRKAGYVSQKVPLDLGQLAGNSTSVELVLPEVSKPAPPSHRPAQHPRPKKHAHEDIPIFQ